MGSPQRILVLANSAAGGDWPPLAAVTVGLHQAGHAVQCFGDPAIAQAFASTAIAVEVVPPDDLTWARADACLPAVRALVRDFAPRVVLSQLFTAELARLVKAACGLRWCCVNATYYFGPDSRRPFEADFTGAAPKLIPQILAAMAEADLVLHATDPIFDPPPPSLPRHHQHVGTLMWEPSSAVPTYLDIPGAPWVLVTLSSAAGPGRQVLREGEIALARTALRTLAESPVRVLVTLAAGPPRDELGAVPANARIELFVPHSAVLKRSSLLISHAGHGVVAKALYYGVPMVLVPWVGDQPGVAARAAALGVAEVIARHDFTEQRLSATIQRVLGTPRYQENATRIACRMQTRDAVAMARARIEALLETT